MQALSNKCESTRRLTAGDQQMLNPVGFENRSAERLLNSVQHASQSRPCGFRAGLRPKQRRGNVSRDRAIRFCQIDEQGNGLAQDQLGWVAFDMELREA
jgi:hypothetical protein